MIVVDTSLVVAYLVPHPRNAVAISCFDRDPDWIAPASLRVELVSVFVQMLRRGAIGQADADAALARLADVVRLVELEPASRVLSLAIERRLSGYDAEFLAVAFATDLRVVSDDEQFIERSPRANAILMSSFAAGR